MKKKKTITNELENKEKTKGREADYLQYVKNRHNDFFIQFFSRKDKLVACFNKCFPASTLEMMDLDNFDNLEIVDSKHILELGVNLHSDIVVKIRLKNKLGFLIVIFEAQSTIDENMPFRFLYYIAAVSKKEGEEHKVIPITIGMLLYTGKSPWKTSINLNDYFADPSIGSKYLHVAPFPFMFVPEDINNPEYLDPKLGYGLAAFRCGRELQNAHKKFAEFRGISAFNAIFDNLPKSERILVASYIGSFAKDKESFEKIFNLIITNEKEKEEFMQTYVQTLAKQYQDEGIEIGIEKGLEKGLEKGRYEEKKQVAKNLLLKLHLDLDAVQKATELSREELQKIMLS